MLRLRVGVVVVIAILSLHFPQRHGVPLDSLGKSTAGTSSGGVSDTGHLDWDNTTKGAGVGRVLAADEADVLLAGDSARAGLARRDLSVQREVGGGTILLAAFVSLIFLLVFFFIFLYKKMKKEFWCFSPEVLLPG